jgi:hypothetical protein
LGKPEKSGGLLKTKNINGLLTNESTGTVNVITAISFYKLHKYKIQSSSAQKQFLCRQVQFASLTNMCF